MQNSTSSSTRIEKNFSALKFFFALIFDLHQKDMNQAQPG